MEFIDALTKLGPVAGTIAVVIIFVRFASGYMKNERHHREKIADECHAVQKRATEATFLAVQSMDKTAKVLERVNVTLIRLNGNYRKGD